MAANKAKALPTTITDSAGSNMASATAQTSANNGVATSPSVNTSTNSNLTSPRPKGPPPGYKLVKRRKEDGTLVTMMRKMTLEELEAAGVSQPTATASREGIDYRIVTVKNTDGSFVRVKRPIKQSDKPLAGQSMPAGSPQHTKDSPPVKVNGTDSVSTPQPSAPSSPKQNHHVVEFTVEEIDSPATTPGTSENMSGVLAEQRADYRQRRTQQYKGAMLRGLATILGSSATQTEFSDIGHSFHEHHDGHDEVQDGDILDSDEDMTDDGGDGADVEHNRDSGYHDVMHERADKQGNFASKSHSLSHNDSHTEEMMISGAATAVAAAATSASNKPAPAMTPAPDKKSGTEDEKETYKISNAELELGEKKSAQRDLERPLRRHWTNFAFYFMASLSIILPALFIVLAVFVLAMNGKSVDSSWNAMPQAIKVGVSAWPIVFAAVVAQVFKTYATWKVERGIKLMQLEQFLGSSSFASAVKQPLVLRQLNIVALLLLLTWCLSPLGSQALQRSYSTGGHEQSEIIPVSYLNQLQENKVFSDDWRNRTTEVLHASDNQFVGMNFLSSLLPAYETQSKNASMKPMDRYFHAVMLDPISEMPVSSMGLPVLLPTTQIPPGTVATDQYTPYEFMQFNVSSSYFNFTCGNWNIMSGPTLLSANLSLEWSSSSTLGMVMDTKTTPYRLAFASANIDAPSVTGNIADSEYSFIECTFEQVFIDSQVVCERTAPGMNSTNKQLDSTCKVNQVSLMAPETIENSGYGTSIEDFSDDWTSMGSLLNPNRQGRFSTPTELYALSKEYQMNYTIYTTTKVNLTQSTTSADFTRSIGVLFNTWLGVGYCPECQALTSQDEIDSFTNDNVSTRFLQTQATRRYSVQQVYVVSVPWIAFFIACTCVLVIAGVTSVLIESKTIAPDTLGYVSTAVRNSRYLNVKPTSGAMSGPERARKLADTHVMMQDVKAGGDVGKIALGLKTDNAVKLRYDRLYR